MCVNCNDNVNAVVVYSGPAGPQGDPGVAGAVGPAGPIGPQGPGVGAPGYPSDVTRLSVSSNTIASFGSKTFAYTVTSSNIGWIGGQRLRVSYLGNTSNWMEGIISSVSSTSVTIAIDLSSGSGTYSNWSISIAGTAGGQGTQGPQGPIGISSYTIQSSSIGSGPTYTIQVQSTLWMVVGQIIFIENCGYYQVSNIQDGTTVIISDLAYTGNTPANLSFPPNGVGPGGLAGVSSSTNGTYSPVLKDSASLTVPTVNSGYYCEIGKIVHVEIAVAFSSITDFAPYNGTGSFSLTLPASKNPARDNQYICGSIHDVTTNTYYQLKARLTGTNNTFTLWYLRPSPVTDLGFNKLAPFTVDSSTKLYLSFTYEKG